MFNLSIEEGLILKDGITQRAHACMRKSSRKLLPRSIHFPLVLILEFGDVVRRLENLEKSSGNF